MRERTVGLALAAGRGVFAWWPVAPAAPTAARTETFAFNAEALAAGDDAPLFAALRIALLSATRGGLAGDARCTLHVALASPWTSPRELALPPMRETEARLVLTRDAARHFPITRSEPTVAVRALRRGVWLACDADGVVLDAIARGAQAAGFTAVRIGPAIGAWADAAGDARARAFVVDGEAAVLGAQHGRVVALRRCRTEDLPPGDVAAGDMLALAAANAGRSAEREFVSPGQRAARDAVVARTVRRLIVAGLAAAMLAAVLPLWGSARRVALLERERAELRPAVTPFIALRDSLIAAQEARATLARARAAAPWSARLSALAATLPEDAYFTAFRAAGDSAAVEGTAPDAQAAVARMRATREVRDVRTTVAGTAGAADREPFAAIVYFLPRGVR